MSLQVCVCVGVGGCVFVCVCVCVREREREREREGVQVCVCVCTCHVHVNNSIHCQWIMLSIIPLSPTDWSLSNSCSPPPIKRYRKQGIHITKNKLYMSLHSPLTCSQHTSPLSSVGNAIMSLHVMWSPLSSLCSVSRRREHHVEWREDLTQLTVDLHTSLQLTPPHSTNMNIVQRNGWIFLHVHIVGLD